MRPTTPLLIAMTLVAATPTAGGQETNPLLQEWNTPHQTPPFNQIEVRHFAPAVETAIREAEANVERIASSKESPTFENTVVALQTADERLERITAILFNLNECCTSPELQQTVMELTPVLTRHSNSVNMNQRLFARVKAVYDQREELTLTTEQRTLLEDTYQGFVRHGVALQGEPRKQYQAITERLSELSQMVNQHVLADNNAFVLHITNREDLAGLPDNVVEAARQEALQRGEKEGWLFTLDAPSYVPFMTFANNRELRKTLWQAYNSRGNRGNENDNNALIREMATLRMQLAQLLGYDTYCAYVLSDRMCQSVQQLDNFYAQLMEAALPAARRDLDEVSAYAQSLGAQLPLQRWDFSYYSEKLKRERYDLDQELLRPYFPLDSVRQGIFDLYGRLYGLRFQSAVGVQVYHPDVLVYEVYDGNRLMGLLYLDMHPRSNKRGGAWMTEFRQQSNLNGRQVRPLIQVVCNFSKPVGDKPALLSFDEVNTFMHEMGHAMHGMLTDCTYPSLSGTNVKRDFVELPSQLMENWCYQPLFLNAFAHHYQTGDTLPAEYVERLRAAERYLAGWLCLRQLNLGLTDRAFHTIQQPIESTVEDLEREAMTDLLPPVPGTCTSTAFTHIFAGGYASGYYGYKWAEVLDADVFSRFEQNGIFDPATADLFRRQVLSRGGTQHPSILFRNFMGRDPDIHAFMRRSGFEQ